jgi:pantoate--beta-alanine ligase
MRTVRTIPEMRAAVAELRQGGRSVGLVPTMGAFHDGHLALMRAARAANDAVVVSLFVNPKQFDEPADLAGYPRDEGRDTALAAEEGVDVLFAPDPAEIYPPGFTTTVSVGAIADRFEGAVRGPGHFAGVCTVVTKLLNIVGPERAYFGQKDAQQVAVLRRMATDLDIPARIEVIPTVREPDGLAMSSRNSRLSADERARATALYAGLRAAEAAAAAGEHDAARLRDHATAAMGARAVEPEYVAVVDPDSFDVIATARGRVLLAVAARVGATRLIDNLLIDVSSPAATADPAPTTKGASRCPPPPVP